MAERDLPASRRASHWLSELFVQHQPTLLRGLRSRTRDPEDMADLVQDAFERLVTAAPRPAPDVPQAYLRRVVRNLAIDRFRRSTCRPGSLVSIDDVVPPAVPPEQEHGLALEDLMRQYRAAIATLTPRTREVFLMHRVDDLTYRQIADRLGISTATVEYHIGRALAHLAERLDR